MLKLIPYPSKSGETIHAQGPAGLLLEADARIEGSGDQRKLILTYSAGRALDQILWPASLTSKSQRKDGLWKHTCFEAFIKPADQDRYWEINLSPTGDWNAYRFTSYRQGMAIDESIQALQPAFSKNGESWQLSCEIWIPEWKTISAFDIGLTSVIEETSGVVSYWAIHHAGQQPDFHLAESFSKRI